MKQIGVNFKGYYKEIILGPLFKLFEAVLELCVPLVMANIIDVGIRTANTAYIVKNGLLMLLLAVLGAVAGLTCQYYAAVAAGHFGRRLRNQLYRHIMRFSAAETGKFGVGGLITRLTNDVNQIQQGVNMVIRLGTRAPFLVVGSLIMALALNLKIGLVFLAAAPVITLAMVLIVRLTLPGYTAIQAKQDKMSRLSGESIKGVRVIRAFSRQKKEKQEFDAAGDDMTALLVRVGKLSSALNPITTLIANVAIVAIVWLGAKFAFRGEVLPGEIIALVSYMSQILLALLVAVHLVILFTRGIASAKRVATVLETEPMIVDGSAQQQTPAQDACDVPAVAFRNVSFAYHKGAGEALENIDFTVQPGQTVGIIGGTGSGKTTLVNLILRYFDVSAGAVLVGGVDVRHLSLQKLRRKIGLVPQKATLFSGSVRYNLNMGLAGALGFENSGGTAVSDDILWKALEQAQAGFVREMSGGLDAQLTEGGGNLSGGQKQRLTIARALIRRPEILILDDASSALDYATDAALRKALRQSVAGANGAKPMTLFMISQRVSAIKKSDLILVLDDGLLVGAGSHAQLAENNAIYREICISQGVLKGEAG